MKAGLEKELADPQTLRGQVFARYRDLLARRAACQAFHPNGSQKILDMGSAVFASLRSSPMRDRQVLCLQNVTAKSQRVPGHELKPYQTLWLDK